MKIEFNEDGGIKFPKEVEESRKKFKEMMGKAKENPDKVIVKYEQISSEYEDNWIITLPRNIPRSILFDLRKWANTKHKIIRGSASIEQQNGNKFVLVVRGYKNRCTWAHAFLNGLNTALIKDYSTEIRYIRTCKHKFQFGHKFYGKA